MHKLVYVIVHNWAEIQETPGYVIVQGEEYPYIYPSGLTPRGHGTAMDALANCRLREGHRWSYMDAASPTPKNFIEPTLNI